MKAMFPLTVLGALVAAGLLAYVLAGELASPPPPTPAPAPSPPAPPPQPRPRPRPCPGPGPCPLASIMPFGKLSLGGPTAPDGRTQVQCDLPLSLRLKNVGGTDGAGLCVFSSINMAAYWQNARDLFNFQKQMRGERGGGWPQKVEDMMFKYAPYVPYLQYEGKDPSILMAALASGRMPSVTYCGRDPHYRGPVSHMVNLVYLDAGMACILDNNYIGEQELVWMSAADFLDRWTQGGQGWAVILLNPAPPPVPRLPVFAASDAGPLAGLLFAQGDSPAPHF